MRRSLSLAAAILVSAPASAADRSFPVGPFDRVILAAASDVEVRVGPATAVTATGDQADLDRLDIRVENGALVIGSRPGRWTWRTRGGVRVAVRTPALAAATISGSGSMTIDRVAGGAFAGRISGSGDLSLADVAVETLALSISGSGTLRAAGACASGDIRISGSGNIESKGLACRNLTAAVTGSGNVRAGATDTADLRVTGSGNIVVTGGARCTSRSTGSGTIRCG